MRIAVLEWLSGGGLSTESEQPSQSHSSLKREGCAMVLTLCGGLSPSGCEVLVPWSYDRACSDQERDLVSLRRNLLLDSNPRVRLLSMNPTSTTDELLEAWSGIADQADWTIVIAPECDGILQNCVATLRQQVGDRLLTSCGPFLNATCSKLATAEKLSHAGLVHPATIPIDQANESWQRQHRQDDVQHGPRWIVKPDDGAGCEALKIVDTNELNRLRRSSRQLADPGRPSHEARVGTIDIVQPYLCGDAMSICVTAKAGELTWFPLCQQLLHPVNSSSHQSLSYIRSQPCMQEIPPALRDTVQRALGALGSGAMGWIGIDLLCCKKQSQWVVIEINPRFTTSVVGLAAHMQEHPVQRFIDHMLP